MPLALELLGFTDMRNGGYFMQSKYYFIGNRSKKGGMDLFVWQKVQHIVLFNFVLIVVRKAGKGSFCLAMKYCIMY